MRWEEIAMSTVEFSDAARDLLRRRLAGEWVEVTGQTRPLYRELVEAGMMIPLHSFARGEEGAYRLTEAACRLRDSLRDGVTFPAIPSPSA
jgi:hypothetical protein